MNKHCELLELRLALDEAITYKTKTQALGIARQGIREARAKGLAGELEYFQGQMDILKGNFVSAIEHFDAAVKYNPSDGASYNDRALCMVELGIIDEALAYFDKGIEVEPDYATIYHNKGWLLNNIGRHTEAIRCFQKALELEPERPVTYENIADALYNLKDYPGALAAYRKSLAYLKPDYCPSIKRQIAARVKELEK
jgi:tetratricopeptide (TPR) repeat protein